MNNSIFQRMSDIFLSQIKSREMFLSRFFLFAGENGKAKIAAKITQ